MAFGFMDSQAQINYDLTPHHNLKVRLVDGTSDFDRSNWRDRLALNASMTARYHFTLANLAWQYTPSPTFLLTSHAAFMRERYDDTNRDGRGLGEGFYGEWVGKSDATWMWSRAATLDFGVSARRVRGEGFSDYYFDNVAHTRVEGHRGNLTMLGGYAQQSWSGLGKRLFISAGMRWDEMDASGSSTVSPQASVAYMPTASTKVQVSWGRYAQFPDVQELYSLYGSTRLRPEHATHYVAAVEQRLGGLARLRVQAYQRVDRDLLFRPFQEARLAAGQIIPDNFQAPITNSLRGYAKGVEVFLQKRTANRLTGWVSYALGYSRQRDALSGASFFSDQDQRHTVNVYLGYRIRPSVNLSAKWTYGSGFPVPGYFRREGDTYFLSSVRNGARLDPYQRTDVRINKSRTFDRWKITVYAEVVNMLNRPNYRFDSYNGYDGTSGQAYVNFSNMFPILPSAGVMFEF
jgi:outer membrane receptor for ferrienterochelin and colicin